MVLYPGGPISGRAYNQDFTVPFTFLLFDTKGIFFFFFTVLFLFFFFSENERSSNPNLFEGDMILSAEQRLEMINGNSRQSRGAHKLRRWPGGVVPYTIDWSLGIL